MQPTPSLLPATEEASPKPPVVVPVTQEWLAEMQRRQMAYAAKRAAWTAALFQGQREEPPAETKSKQSSRKGTIFDKRQFRFDL
jgi:hypothetical protein